MYRQKERKGIGQGRLRLYSTRRRPPSRKQKSRWEGGLGVCSVKLVTDLVARVYLVLYEIM